MNATPRSAKLSLQKQKHERKCKIPLHPSHLHFLRHGIERKGLREAPFGVGLLTVQTGARLGVCLYPVPKKRLHQPLDQDQVTVSVTA